MLTFTKYCTRRPNLLRFYSRFCHQRLWASITQFSLLLARQSQDSSRLGKAEESCISLAIKMPRPSFFISVILQEWDSSFKSLTLCKIQQFWAIFHKFEQDQAVFWSSSMFMKFDHVQGWSSIFKYVQAYSSMLRQVQACFIVSSMSQAYSSMF